MLFPVLELYDHFSEKARWHRNLAVPSPAALKERFGGFAFCSVNAYISTTNEVTKP